MLRSAALAGAVILSASCNRSEGGDAIGNAAAASASSSKPTGSGTNFSAEMAKELGAGPAGKPGDSAVAGGDTRGEGKGGDPKVGAGADPAAKADAKGGTPASDGKGAVAAVDPAAKAGAPSSAGKGGDGKGGGTASAMAGADPAAKAGSPSSAAKPADAKSDGKSGDGKGGAPASDTRAGAPATDPAKGAPAVAATPTPAAGAPASRGPVKVSADLAAIKLSLLPNWDRDLDEAGTFQYVVRIKGTQTTKTFSFRYGYDDPRAPADRDQYKKYLQDTRALTGEIKDRQRGAAWFLEGTDASGLPAFRYVVLYGGKRLICYGSLYKDAESNRLGDDRDQTLIQAKQICETLAL